MSLVKKFQIVGLDLVADCSIPAKDYADHKARVQDQLIKNIEVPGFRKGKAPLDIALKNINEQAFANQVHTEVIDKFFPEIGKEAEEYLKENGRAKSDLPADITENSIEETEDSLNFSFKLKLLPKIDLESFAKIKVTKTKPEELENLVSFEKILENEKKSLLGKFNEYEKVDAKAKKDSQVVLDIQEIDLTNHENAGKAKKDEKVSINLGFNLYPENFEKELVGLKAGEDKEFETELQVAHEDHTHMHQFKYVVHCYEVGEPKYKTLEEVIENVAEAKKTIESVDKLKEKLQKLYDQEIELKTGQKDQQKIIQSIVKEVKVPDLSIIDIDNEVERIYSSIKQLSEEQKVSLAEIFVQTGLPSEGKKTIKDDEVFGLVRSYVENEFKLVEMLRSIYIQRVEEKITTAEIDTLAKRFAQNPTQYGISKNEASSSDALKNVAYDRLIREKAFIWIKNQIQLVD